jgi:uncharacterized protein with von Willebrand factor type A (vWA) domain
MADPVLALAATARRAGLAVGPDRVLALARATDALGLDGLYWAGRLTLCSSPEDVARYEAVFAGQDLAAPRRSRTTPRVSAEPGALFAGSAGPGADDGGPPLAVRASGVELLRHRDLVELSTVERDEVRRLLALLAPVAPRRPGRRRRPASRGGVDARRTSRAMLRAGGEPVRLSHWRRRTRPRRLVLLVDVSGSMAPYADGILRFAHAAVRSRPRTTEAYTLGTRLTRVTPALLARDPAQALAAAGALIPDWRGGTRLGDGLRAFLRRDGHRGMARRAVVVVFSDGWERGDPTPLAGAAAHLGRLAYRVIWVSPHAGRPGFAPLAGGLAAVLPHLDALVAGHSLAALEELVREVGRA